MKAFETVSFHIVKPCNMGCKFCYATFDDMNVKQLPFEDACAIIDKLKDAGVQKITFAGGEPLLYRHIKAVVNYAWCVGITTSIITNGSLLNDEWLSDMQLYLDWIGISIDSTNVNTNTNIGRSGKETIDYFALCDKIKSYGYKLKINTVVNRYNYYESMSKLIRYANPERWKVFQTLRVKGQNDAQFDEIKCTDDQFNNFIDRHLEFERLVPENNEAMTGSYLLIDPQGRCFENSKGEHTYSDSLVHNTIDHCLSQININRETFISRGGIYNW